MSQTIFGAKIRKKRVYLLPKVKPHLPNNPKFVRLANTICASSQNRIWRSPGQIEDLKFTKSVSELRQAGLNHTKLKKWTCFEAICFFEPFKMTRRNDEIYENQRKSSKILDRYPTKIQKKSRFEHVQVTLWKNRDFHVRNASGLVNVTLCSKRRNFMDFHSEIARIHTKFTKWTYLDAICFLEAFKNMCKTLKFAKIRENLRKSSMSTLQKSTKNQFLSTSR